MEAPRRLYQLGVQTLTYQPLSLLAGGGDQARVQQARHQQAGVVAVLGPGCSQEIAWTADLEVDLGEVEATGVADHGAEAAVGVSGVGRVGVGEQQAERLVFPSADAAAELVQLGETETLGALDHHHGGVGHIDADLHHRSADQDLVLVSLEGLHHSVLLGGLHAAVQERQAQLREHLRLQPLVLAGRGAGLDQVGILYQRADDEDLAAVGNLTPDEVISLVALGRRDQPGVDHLAARRHLVQHRHRQVAVERQLQGPRDGGRRHREHVRVDARPLRQRFALADAKPMLLIADHQAQVVGHDSGLDQRVGADQQVELAPAQLLQDAPAIRRRGRSDQQVHAHSQWLQVGAQGPGVLLGEDLGRRHHQRLVARPRRHRGRHRRHRGLAAADIALQQPGHRPRLGKVFEHGVGGLALGVGETEGKGVANGPGALDVVVDHRRGLVLPLLPADQHRDLHQQQLPEGDAFAGLVQLLLVAGVMHLADRTRQRWQALAPLDIVGHLVAHLVGACQGGIDAGADPAGGEAVGLWVNRHQPPGVEATLAATLEGGVHHRQAAASTLLLDLAGEHDLVADMEALGEVRLVEPDRLHPAAVIAEKRFGRASAPTAGTRTDHLDSDLDGLLGALHQEDHVDGAGEVLVPARIVLQQVPDGVDAQPLELLGVRRGDPGECGHRGLGWKRQPSPPAWRCRRRPRRRARSGFRSRGRLSRRECPWRQGSLPGWP